MSEGLASIIPAVVGMAAGYLYDVDWFGSQTYRIPQPIERFFSKLASFFAFSAGVIPANNNPGRLGTPRRRNNSQEQAPLNQGALLRENNTANDGNNPLNNNNSSSGGIRFRPQTQQAAPPDEQSITLLMGMGFDREAVVRALTATGNNVESAANLLVH